MEISESTIKMYDDILQSLSNKSNAQTSSTQLVEPDFSADVDQIENNESNTIDNNNQEFNTSTTTTTTTTNHHNIHDNTSMNDNNEFYGHDQYHSTTINLFETNNTSTSIKSKVIKINEINIDIDFTWEVHAFVTCKHPKRTYTNANGEGEISTWDLSDDTGAINLVAFNLDSYVMSIKLIEGKAYAFANLSIRTIDNMYKKLENEYQLIVNKSTDVREIKMSYSYETKYDFTDLNEIETLPLNSIIDVQVNVLRDYGITAGNTNGNSWIRRELHVAQDGVHIKLTLWNQQAKEISKSVIQKTLKIKNIKIDFFNGLRTLVSMANTRLTIV